MSTITLRSVKGSPLTNAEVDANFSNLNTDKYQEGSDIGAVTPAAGTFTTLTATGQTSLGGAAGSESLRVVTNPSGTDYLQAIGSTFGRPVLRSSGTGNPSLGLSSQGTGSIQFYTNVTAQEQMRITHTASAVNYVQVTGAATGSGPTLSAQGSDTNIQMIYASKGGFGHLFKTSGNTNQFSIAHTGSTANFPEVVGAATGFGVVYRAAGSDTNIPLVLQPKGTGALQAQQTDSTATGGNARGANAVDWQTSRATAAQVASGQLSFIGGGTNNIASQYNSTIVGGFGNTVSQVASFIGAGSTNTASGAYGAIISGVGNTTAGYMNFIGGGFTNSGTSGSAVTTQSGTMNGTTAVTLSGSNANIKVGQLISGTSIASDTYVAAISGTSLTLSKAASGSSTSTLSFYTPHGVVVGGGNNQATGSYSFIGGGGDAGTAANRNVASGDWSVVVGGVKNTASGVASFVGGGGIYDPASGGYSANLASGLSSFVGAGFGNTASSNATGILSGVSNVASGIYSAVVGGTYGSTRGILANIVLPAANNPFNASAGASQAALLVLGKQTTDATPVVITCNGSAAGTTNQVILPNNSAYYFRGTVVAGVTGGGNTKGWTIEGVIKRGANAAATSLVGTPVLNLIAQDAGASTWVIAVTADTTNGGLAVTFTGQAATTIRCVAKIETTEMTY